MKVTLLRYLLITGMIGLFLGCQKPDNQAPSNGKEEKGASVVQHNADGETVLHLDEEAQKRIGLKTETLKAIEVPREVKAYGKVLDAEPLLVIANEIEVAQAASDLSEKEFARAKVLHEQNNISEQAFQTARAAVTRDQLTLQATKDKLLGWGKKIANYDKLSGLARSLVTMESALIRVDLPLGEDGVTIPERARLTSLTDNASTEGVLMGESATANPQTQNRGFVYLMETNTLHVVSGSALLAFLPQPQKHSGVKVPSSAIVRHMGKTWIYLRSGQDEFTRKEISLDSPVQGGWLTRGMSGEVDAVTTGAEQLLSEEMKASFSE